MQNEVVTQKILSALEQAALNHHIDIVDVEIVGSSKNPLVRVRIDHDDETEETISLDEVAQETSWISETIDELDPFPASFTLEVSSPGMARPLRRAKDFVRFAGQEVQLQTTATEGRRKFTGTLLGIEGTTISIQTEDEVCTIDLSELKKCVIKPAFDFLTSAKKQIERIIHDI